MMQHSDPVSRVREIVLTLKNNAHEAIAFDALLRRINDHDDILAAFRQTVEAHGLNAIQHSLIHLYLMALTRCYDAKGPEIASLPAVVMLLKQPEIFAETTESARSWLPENGFAEKNYCTSVECISTAIRDYERLRACQHTKLRALREYRNTYVAHSLLPMGSKERLLFGYLRYVLQETVPIIRALLLGVHGTEWESASTFRVWENNANAFWRRTLR
jgi:hypothetical protein